MKTFLILLFFLLTITYSQSISQSDKKLYLEKNKDSSFTFFDASRNIVGGSTLNYLNAIYKGTSSDNKTDVAIVNLSEKGFDCRGR